VQDQLMDAERRYEDTKDALELEKRKTRDEVRKRKQAESRVLELEEKVKLSEKEIEETKEARAKDAQDLLANARERLEILHNEVSPHGVFHWYCVLTVSCQRHSGLIYRMKHHSIRKPLKIWSRPIHF
jgi:hypothetical protein